MGIIYMGIELLWRQKTDISMLFVGGLCSYLVGKLNEQPRFYNKNMWKQCIIGTVIVLVIEFISGIILNVWLGLNIWDYSDMRWNLYGQICLSYTLLWFVLMPLCIYVDDWLRWKLFNEEKPSDLLNYYCELITIK